MVESFILNDATSLENINIIGLHYHVGSQILNLNVFRDLTATANSHLETLQDKGVKIEHVNFGGGLGIDYVNPEINSVVDFDKYFASIASDFKFKNSVTVHFLS